MQQTIQVNGAINVVDSIGDVGSDSAIAVTPDGTIHIVYQDNTNGALKYASNEAGSWNVLMSIPGSEGSNTSIAIDNSSNIHIGYEKANEVRYAAKISGVWQPNVLVGSGSFSSMDLDSSGTPHFSYTHSTSMHLMYASKQNDNSWLVSDLGVVGAYASLAIDTADTANIIFGKQGGYIAHAKKILAGNWEIVDKVNGHDFDGYFSADTDASNRLFYVYKEIADKSLFANSIIPNYVRLVTTEDIDIIPYGVVADSQKHVHITYYDIQNRDLKYATNRYYGRWATAVIEAYNNVGEYSSIAMDKNDQIHVSYSSKTSEGLERLHYYSIPKEGFGTILNKADVDMGGTAGRNNSIFVDDNGLPGIYYNDNSANRKIKLALRDSGGNWSLSTLSISSDARYPSARARSLKNY